MAAPFALAEAGDLEPVTPCAKRTLSEAEQVRKAAAERQASAGSSPVSSTKKESRQQAALFFGIPVDAKPQPSAAGAVWEGGAAE